MAFTVIDGLKNVWDKLKETPVPATENVYQQNLSQPVQANKWYKGNTPTSREIYGQIGRIYESNPEGAGELLSYYRRLQNTPGNEYYWPYQTATNQAVYDMASYGYDMSNIGSDDWFNANIGLRTYTTNVPSKPGKKSSQQEYETYGYYQLGAAHDDTKNVNKEWAALQKELSYWANDPIRNYTDDEIINNIDWKKYPTLAKLNDSVKTGGKIVKLNQGTDYSWDAMYGTIWAARNGGGTGNAEVNAVYSAMGAGNQYKEDPELRAKLDPNNENYSPYSVGSTMEKEGLYFDRHSFNQKWLDQNADMLNSQDATERQMYLNVMNAESYTQKLEQQKAAMDAEIERYLTYTDDPDKIINAIFDNDEYKDLFTLDDTISKKDKTKLKATTRAVNYRREDVEAMIRQRCEAKKNGETPVEKTGNTVEMVTGTKPEQSETEIKLSAQQVANLNGAGLSVIKYGTDSEKQAYVASQGGFMGAAMDLIGQSMIDFLKSADLVANSCYDIAKLGFGSQKAAAEYRVVKDQRDKAIYEQYGYMTELNELVQKFSDGTITNDELQRMDELSARNKELSKIISNSQEYMDNHAEEVKQAKIAGSRTAANIAFGAYLSDEDKAMEQYATAIHDNRVNWLMNGDFNEMSLDELDESYAMWAKEMNAAQETYENEEDSIAGYCEEAVRKLAGDTGNNAMLSRRLTEWVEDQIQDGAPRDYDYWTSEKVLYAFYEQATGEKLEYPSKEELDQVREAMDKIAQFGNLRQQASDANDKLWAIKDAKEKRRTIIALESNATGDGTYDREKMPWNGYNNAGDVDGVYFYANQEEHNELLNMNAHFMSDKERTVFNQYYNAGEKEKAYDYYNAIKPTLEKRRAKANGEYLASASGGDFGWAVGLVSVPLNIVSGITGAVGTIAYLIGVDSSNNSMDYIFDPTSWTGTIRETRGEVWDDGLVNLFGDGAKGVGRFLNGVAYSIMDNLSAIGAAGGIGGAKNVSQGMVQLLMSSEATASAMYQNLESGMDVTEAAFRAIGSGAIEAFTEKYSLEALLNPDLGALIGDWKNVTKFMLKNVIAEGSEEAASDVLELVMDVAISAIAGHENEIESKVKALLAENPDMAMSDAINQVWGGFFNDTLTSAAAGGLSGFIMSGGRVGLTAVGFAKNGRINRSDMDAIIANGLNSDDAEIQQLAKELQQQQESGKRISNYDLGRLAYGVGIDSVTETANIEQQDEEQAPAETAPVENYKDAQLTKDLTILFQTATNGDDQAQGSTNIASVLYTDMDKTTAIAAGMNVVHNIAGGDAHVAAHTVAGLLDVAVSAAKTQQAAQAVAAEVTEQETPAKAVNMEEAAQTVAKGTSALELLGWSVKEEAVEGAESDETQNVLYDENGNRIGTVGNNGTVFLDNGVDNQYSDALANAGYEKGPYGGYENRQAADVITKTSPAAQNVVQNAVQNASRDALSGMKKSIAFASVTGGEANNVLREIASKVANNETVTKQDADALLNAVTEDMTGPNSDALNAQMQSAIDDTEIAMEEMGILSDRGVDNAVKAAEANVNQAKNALAAAQAQQQRAQAEAEAAADNLRSAESEYNPSIPETAATLQQAANHVAGTVTNKNQAAQTVANAQQKVADAEKNLEQESNAAMNVVRQEAIANVQQQKAEAAAQAAQKAEQQRIAEEQAAQMQAVEEENRNAAYMDAEELIADRYPNATEEEKAKIRDMVNEIRRESSATAYLNRAKFAKQVAKKFGVKIEVKDTTNGGTVQRQNAYVNPKTGVITLDVNATTSDAMYAILGHELFHIAKNSNTYNDLYDALVSMEYGDETGRLESDIKAKQELYARKLVQMGEIQNESEFTVDDAKEELAADLMGKLLGGNQELLNRFAAEQPSVARRILDSIKSFLKRIGGIKGAPTREMKRTVDMLEKALQQAQQNQANQDRTKHSLMAFDDGTRFVDVDIDQNLFDGLSVKDMQKKAKDIIKEKFQGKTIGIDNQAIVTGKTAKEYSHTYDRNIDPNAYKGKLRASTELDNLLDASAFIKHKDDGADGHYHKDVVDGFDYYKTIFKVGNDYFEGTINIANTIIGKKFYDVTKLKNITQDILSLYGTNPATEFLRNVSMETVTQDENSVKPLVTDENGNAEAVELPGGTEYVDPTIKHSLSSFNENEQKEVRNALLASGRFTSAEVDRYMNDALGIAATIAADRARLDFTADPTKTMLKPNAEYVKTLDASTLCAKRLVYQGTFDAIQHALPNTPLMPTDLIDLANMMREMGYEAPCGICYVESRRRNLGKFAQGWLDSYDGAYKPTLDQVTTTDGLEELRTSHPDTYKDFVDAMNKKGTMNPKVVQLRTDYRGEIRDMTEAQIQKVKDIGGLRVQSFSDFETPHLLDMVQAVMDMSARDLTAQAYTKVPNFAWVFGGTGIKINLSLIGKGTGLDSNGNLLFDDVEGMPFDQAMKVRDMYSQNVGTILVGINDDHIKAAMADPRIDYIIPFHKSGWSAEELEKMPVLNDYSDYTNSQNEKAIVGKDKKGGYKTESLEKTKRVNFQPVGENGYWDFNKSGKENAEAYLKMCAEDKRLPKFSQFLVDNGDGSFSLQPDGSTDGYWKTLIDFKMYDNDGNGAPQQEVTPNINMNQAMRVLGEFDGRGVNSLPVAQPVVDRYVEEFKAKNPGRKYSLPSIEVQEAAEKAFKNSKARTEDGKLMPVYHGTSADFNVFDTSISGGKNGVQEGYGIYLTDNPEIPKQYGGRTISAYVNMERPAYADKKTIKRSELAKVIKATCENEAHGFVDEGSYDNVNDAIQDTWISNYIYTPEYRSINDAYNAVADLILDQNDNDSDIVGELLIGQGIRDYGRAMDFYHNILTPLTGIDGIWAKWSNKQTGETSNVLLAFDSSQIKSSEAVTYDDKGNAIPIDQRFNRNNPDIRYSLPEDASYIAAVERGEMDEAQRMVNQAAEQSGYTDVAYHGTNKFGFTQFDMNEGQGAIFVSYSPNVAGTYAEAGDVIRRVNESDRLDVDFDSMTDQEFVDFLNNMDEKTKSMFDRVGMGFRKAILNDDGWIDIDVDGERFGGGTKSDLIEEFNKLNTGVYELYTKPGKQLVIETDGASWHSIPWALVIDSDPEAQGAHPEMLGVDTRTVALWAKEHGYDSVRINAIYDDGGYSYDLDRAYGDIGIFFNPNDVKSADPVTYDDSGNVIPLNERFREKNRDIRYSLPEDAPYMAAVERGEMDEAQTMVDQKAQEAGYNIKAYHGTGNNFTVFNPEKIGNNYRGYSKYGKGFYFSDSEDTANKWGKNRNVMGAYLKMDNPYVLPLVVEDGPLLDEYNRLRADENKNLKPASAETGAFLIEMLNGLTNDKGYSTEFLKSLGYDGIIVEHPQAAEGTGTAWSGTTEYVVFDNTNIKSSDPVTYDNSHNVIPLSERFQNENNDIRYSLPSDNYLKEQIRAYLESQQQNPNQPVTEPAGPQRQFGNQTAQRSDELADVAKRYLYEHSNYTPDTNQSQVERAVDWIRGNRSEGDPEGYMSSVQKVVGKNYNAQTPDGQARMLATLAMAIAKGDVAAQTMIADAYNKEGTTAGQTLQSRKIFRLMTPEGRVTTLRKMLTDEQSRLNAKGIDVNLKFSDWIYRAAAAASEEGDFQKVRKAAAEELAEQLPSNWREKIRSFRMLSMLANPRTHIRNIIGNAMFIPAVSLKNKLGAVMETGMAQGNRTKTLSPILSKDIREFARQDAIKMKETLTGEAKYNEETLVEQAKKPFSGAFQWLSDLNSNALEAEDWFFLKGHYRRALGGWMQANGYSVADVQDNAELLDKGRAYAIQEAQKATYRDFNQLASTLNQISRKGGVAGFLTDAVLPFKKTPANILKRGLEYSPIGLAKSLTADMYHLREYQKAMKNGTAMPTKAMSPTQVIDDICSGLSGSAVFTLGMILANLGLVSVGLDDDDDEFDKLRGEQEYAVRFNLFGSDVTFTMDWAAPMSMPFFVGAAVQKQFEDQGEVNIEDLANAAGNIMEPVFNLSMLDGVNTLFKTSQNDDTNTLTQIGAKVLSNYATSYVPSIAGAVARTIDDKRRKAYVKSGEGQGVLGTFRYAYEQTQNKIPGWSQTNIPYRDVWGNAEESGLLERIAENFILPGYVQNRKEDIVVDELERLYNATGNASMIPKDPGKTITLGTQVTDNPRTIKLTDQEWDDYKVARGQTAYNTLQDMMTTDYYLTADPEEQAELVSDVWKYANIVGKQAVAPDYKPEKDYGNDPVQTIIDKHKKDAKDNTITALNTEMLKAVEAKDVTAYDTVVEALHENGVDDSTIKTKIASKYRDQYKAAYKADDLGKMIEIENMLDMTGFRFDFKQWRKDADKKQD